MLPVNHNDHRDKMSLKVQWWHSDIRGNRHGLTGPGALTTVLLKVSSWGWHYGSASGAGVATGMQMSPLKLCVLGLWVHIQNCNDHNLYESLFDVWGVTITTAPSLVF